MTPQIQHTWQAPLESKQHTNTTEHRQSEYKGILERAKGIRRGVYLTTKYKLPNRRLGKRLCDPNLPSKQNKCPGLHSQISGMSMCEALCLESRNEILYTFSIKKC